MLEDQVPELLRLFAGPLSLREPLPWLEPAMDPTMEDVMRLIAEDMDAVKTAFADPIG